VETVTGFPSILEGRVKTLHPLVFGGILWRRNRKDDRDTVERFGIPSFDMVVVDLYPFEDTVASGAAEEDIIEKIDIGGISLLRAAAKNFEHCWVVSSTAQYGEALELLRSQGGTLTLEQRRAFAGASFRASQHYDAQIAAWITGSNEPFAALQGPRMALRYGENPHQSAAFYRDSDALAGSLANYRQLQGKELSYNNIADADAAWECVKTFDGHACVIIKHANPCGVAVASDAASAYAKAFQTDPTSAFGGIIAFNCVVDAVAAEAVAKQFVEVLIAPSFTPDALKFFEAKQNVRLLQIPLAREQNAWDMKRVGGGLLLQAPDAKNVQVDEFKIVSKKQPTPAELNDMMFAWRVAKFVKSNAIVFCGNGMTLGVGAGQMSRVDSARIASIKAQNAGLTLAGSAVASDAFFPFRDGLDAAAAAGVRAIIQPGGSKKDPEVIAAANEHGIAMVFTGHRHFRH
jgi:phosphoribosylaminoimidazolecarboxamide formyltransferase/IMP cyclohydrolase